MEILKAEVLQDVRTVKVVYGIVFDWKSFGDVPDSDAARKSHTVPCDELANNWNLLKPQSRRCVVILPISRT